MALPLACQRGQPAAPVMTAHHAPPPRMLREALPLQISSCASSPLLLRIAANGLGQNPIFLVTAMAKRHSASVGDLQAVIRKAALVRFAVQPGARLFLGCEHPRVGL